MEHLFRVTEYGRIALHLREIMDSRGINRNRLANAAGVNYPVIDRWYNENVERLDLDVLARICYVLDCQVEDLLTYEKPEEGNSAEKGSGKGNPGEETPGG